LRIWNLRIFESATFQLTKCNL